MADEEFHNAERIPLLSTLKSALHKVQVSPTTLACLWLADISCLQELIKRAENDEGDLRVVLGGVEKDAKPVLKCMFIAHYSSQNQLTGGSLDAGTQPTRLPSSTESPPILPQDAPVQPKPGSSTHVRDLVSLLSMRFKKAY